MKKSMIALAAVLAIGAFSAVSLADNISSPNGRNSIQKAGNGGNVIGVSTQAHGANANTSGVTGSNPKSDRKASNGNDCGTGC